MREHIIPSEIHSDDHRTSAQFDAAAWLETATERCVKNLAEDGWCCSKSADRVALEHPDPTRQIAGVFDYIETIRESGRQMGFEVLVNEESAIKWLLQNRPDWTWVQQLQER